MHMLENGFTKDYIHRQYGISSSLLGYLWSRYQSEGPTGLLKKHNIKANYALKLQVIRDIEENHLTLVDASLKYNVSSSRIYAWQKIAKTQGYDALAITRPRGRPPKNDMGRPRKKKPEEMTELELLQLRVKELVKYIRYYNNDRIKLRLNGKNPVQYRALFQSKSAS